MNDTRVARRYAKALFGAASASSAVTAVESDLNNIVNSLQNDSRFAEFIDSPRSSRDDKHALLTNVFGDRAAGLTMQVLRIMLDKGRESEIENVRDEYVALRRESEGVLLATVTSSHELDEAQKQALTAKLIQQLNKKVETVFRIDTSLIGGLRVAYGDYVLDGSVRGTLSNLRERLRHDVLHQP